MATALLDTGQRGISCRGCCPSFAELSTPVATFDRSIPLKAAGGARPDDLVVIEA
jgi:hypothetical protein